MIFVLLTTGDELNTVAAYCNGTRQGATNPTTRAILLFQDHYLNNTITIISPNFMIGQRYCRKVEELKS